MASRSMLFGGARHWWIAIRFVRCYSCLKKERKTTTILKSVTNVCPETRILCLLARVNDDTQRVSLLETRVFVFSSPVIKLIFLCVFTVRLIFSTCNIVVKYFTNNYKCVWSYAIFIKIPVTMPSYHEHLSNSFIMGVMIASGALSSSFTVYALMP